MRDQERIEMYHLFGAMDRRSEEARANAGAAKRTVAARGLRIIRLANLLWAALLKNLSWDKK